MSDNPISQFTDLDGLMTMLDVNVVALAECFVSRGWRLSFPASKIDAVAVGEIGLGGEVRPVPKVEQRTKEAAKLGFGLQRTLGMMRVTLAIRPGRSSKSRREAVRQATR